MSDDLFAWFRGRHREAGIVRVGVVRDEGPTRIEVHTARPGLVIGKQGAVVAATKVELEAMLGPVELAIYEVRRAELEPLLVADQVVRSLEAGVAAEGVLDRCLRGSMRAGAQAMRVRVTGAFGEHEREGYAEGYEGARPLDDQTGGARGAVAEGQREGAPARVAVWLA